MSVHISDSAIYRNSWTTPELRAPFDDAALTAHSLFGLIRVLQRRCPSDSGEWSCYGATVQDITDTHTARTLVKVREVLRGQLAIIADTLCGLASRRDTPTRALGAPGHAVTGGEISRSAHGREPPP